MICSECALCVLFGPQEGRADILEGYACAAPFGRLAFEIRKQAKREEGEVAFGQAKVKVYSSRRQKSHTGEIRNW